MEFKQLKSGIKEISDIASGVPEQFRAKCFEILLTSLLAESKPKDPPSQPPRDDKKQNDTTTQKEPAPPPTGKIEIQSQLRLLVAKGGVTEDEMNKVAFVDAGVVNFIREPKPSGIREGQLEFSLMLAFKNAILKNVFETDAEEVRSKCIDAGYYDRNNFSSNFKSPKFQSYFKGLLKAQGGSVALTADGQDALAALIRRLAGETK